MLVALPNKRKRTPRDSLQSLPSVTVVTPKGKLKVEVSSRTWDGQEEEEEAVEYFASHCNSLLRSSERLRRKNAGQKGEHKARSVSTLQLPTPSRKSHESDLEITQLIEAGNYIDIDSDNHRALVFAVPYAGSLFKSLEERVRDGACIKGFLDQGAGVVTGFSRPISPRWRSLLIEFLITFSFKARLFNSTLHLAVSMMDRYLECCHRTQKMKDVSLEKLMSIGVACLSISVKYEEPQLTTVSQILAPLVALWSHVLHDAAGQGRRNTRSLGLHNRDGVKMVSPTAQTVKDLQHAKTDLVQTEFAVLAGLLWQVSHPTTWTFLHRYATAGQLRGNQMSIAECLCDRVLLDYSLQHHGPCILAAAIVGLVRALVSQPSWTATLQHTTGLVRADVEVCMRDIHEILRIEQKLRHKSASAAHSDIEASSASTANKARRVIPTSKFYGLDKGQGGKAKGGAKKATSSAAEAEAEDEDSLPFSQDSRGSDNHTHGGYLPGNSVRSKHQDVLYRAIVELPEGGPDANASSGTSSANTSPVRTAPKVSPPPHRKKEGGGRERASSRSTSASEAVEPNSSMDRHHKRDALASASSKLLLGLDQNAYHRFRHPSYSPNRV